MKHQRNRYFLHRLTSATGCLTALVFAAPLNSFAAPAALECPALIPEKSVLLVDTPTGWKSFVGAPLYLHSAAPMNTSPEMFGEMVEDNERRDKKGVVHTFKIDGKFPHGKWLACTYGESGQVTLARRLPDDTNVCTFTYRKGQYVGQNEIKIDCK